MVSSKAESVFGGNVLPRLVVEYLEVRAEAGSVEKRRAKLRELLLPLLEEAGGSYVDEESGQRIFIDRAPRGFEYVPERLFILVKEGKLYQSDFDGCLRTIIDPEKLKELISRGIITERDVTRAGAKVPTRIEERLEVKPIGKGGR